MIIDYLESFSGSQMTLDKRIAPYSWNDLNQLILFLLLT